MNSSRYSPRTDTLLDRLGHDLTPADWAALAVACADQAGLDGDAQARLARELGEVVGRRPRYVLGGRYIPMVIGEAFRARAAIVDFIDAPSGIDDLEGAVSIASGDGKATDRWLVVDRDSRRIVAARDADDCDPDIATTHPARRVTLEVYSDDKPWSPAQVAALLAELGLDLSAEDGPLGALGALGYALRRHRPGWKVAALYSLGLAIRLDLVGVTAPSPAGATP